jgi:hypothetical protein
VAGTSSPPRSRPPGAPEIDPGSLVGFNPQPDPPGRDPLELAFSILGKGEGATHVNIAVVQDERVLELY